MIITVGNTKGGVGKSTIACNFAVEAALQGKAVLLVDADIQGSSVAFRALREKDDIKAMSITTPTLHKDLKDFNFDIIVIDVGGRETKAFRSAVLACDIMLIPVLPSQYDIWAAGDTVEILREAGTYKNFSSLFVLNQVIPNTLVAQEAVNAIKEFEEIKLLDEVLHSRVDFKNSITHGLGVSEYKPSGKAALEMKNLYKVIMTIWSDKK